MLFQILFMIQAVRIMLLPYVASAATLAFFDTTWLAKTIVSLVIPHFGGKMYA